MDELLRNMRRILGKMMLWSITFQLLQVVELYGLSATFYMCSACNYRLSILSLFNNDI